MKSTSSTSSRRRRHKAQPFALAWVVSCTRTYVPRNKHHTSPHITSPSVPRLGHRSRQHRKLAASAHLPWCVQPALPFPPFQKSPYSGNGANPAPPCKYVLPAAVGCFWPRFAPLCPAPSVVQFSGLSALWQPWRPCWRHSFLCSVRAASPPAQLVPPPSPP